MSHKSHFPGNYKLEGIKYKYNFLNVQIINNK